MSRREAEKLLRDDGDFLVRKSTTNPGSYVLTGMHTGLAKHLLLVDPEGTVRWRERRGAVHELQRAQTHWTPFSPHRYGQKITCSTAFSISLAIIVTTIFQSCLPEVNCFSCSLSGENSDACNAWWERRTLRKVSRTILNRARRGDAVVRRKNLFKIWRKEKKIYRTVNILLWRMKMLYFWEDLGAFGWDILIWCFKRFQKAAVLVV